MAANKIDYNAISKLWKIWCQHNTAHRLRASVRRVKRARDANVHARDWRRETREALP